MAACSRRTAPLRPTPWRSEASSVLNSIIADVPERRNRLHRRGLGDRRLSEEPSEGFGPSTRRGPLAGSLADSVTVSVIARVIVRRAPRRTITAAANGSTVPLGQQVDADSEGDRGTASDEIPFERHNQHAWCGAYPAVTTTATK